MNPPKMDLRQIVTDPANDYSIAPNSISYADRLNNQTGKISLETAASILAPISFGSLGTLFLMSGNGEPDSYVAPGLLYLATALTIFTGYSWHRHRSSGSQ